MTDFDTQLLRKAFGSFMTGVTVVTAKTATGELIGFTANSFTSVSMDPPLLLVCPGNHLSSYSEFNTVSHFAVSILAEGQEVVSNVFASAIEDRFDSVDWYEDQFGTPLIKGVVATFSCSAYQRHVAGDHLVLIGAVQDLQVSDLQGLGYCSNGYFDLSSEQHSDTTAETAYPGIAGAIVEHDGRVLICTNSNGVSIPCVDQTATLGARSSLQHHFDELGFDIKLDTVYSVYDDQKFKKRFTFIRAQASDSDATLIEKAEFGSFELIDSLASMNFQDPTQATMMTRYAAESRLNTFGIYVGSASCGDIHPLLQPEG